MILDDELPGLTYLKLLCQQIPGIEVVRSFNSSLLFLKEAESLEFDLCILDIEMPDLSGLEVAKALNRKPVIFTTGYKEYAADAFDLDAIDYVRKPVTRERLELAVEKAFKRLDKSSADVSYVQLNTNKGKSILYFDQIAVVNTSETDSRDKDVLFNDYSAIRLKNISFEHLLKLLPYGKFCRINKKELIALSRVRFFSKEFITTDRVHSDGKPMVFVLSDAYRKDFLRLLSV